MVLASAKPETLGWRLRRGALSFYITEIISAPFQPVKDLLACPARAERKDRALPRACGRPRSERKLGELANPPGRPSRHARGDRWISAKPVQPHGHEKREARLADLRDPGGVTGSEFCVAVVGPPGKPA